MSSTTETYVPHARDAVVARTNRLGVVACVTCLDRRPDPTLTEPVYGDLHPTDPNEYCAGCGTTLLSLSESCEREHQEQQARWAKGPITHVIEMGVVGPVRCRIY